MVSERKWDGMSAEEKLDTLHEEVKQTKSNTRSLKKMVLDLVGKVNDMRRFMGIGRAT